MSRKLPLVISLAFFSLSLAFPPKTLAQDTFPPFSCYENYYCYGGVHTGSCKATKASAYDRRPAPDQVCYDGDYMHPVSSCISNFKVIKKVKFDKTNDQKIHVNWQAYVKFHFWPSDIPFIRDIADWLEGVQVYLKYPPGYEARNNEGPMAKLSPGLLEYYRNPCGAWGMCEANDYVYDYIDDFGETKTTSLSEVCSHYPPKPQSTEEYLAWLQSEWPKYFAKPGMPFVQRQDTFGWFIPLAALRTNDSFQIINALVEDRGIRFGIPEILRLGGAVGQLWHWVDPFIDNPEVYLPPEEESLQNLDQEFLAQFSPPNPQVLPAQTNDPDAPPQLRACSRGGATDNKPNEKLCAASGCTPETTTIVGLLKASDTFENPYYEDCHLVQITDPNICLSCENSCSPCSNPCIGNAVCQQNPGSCRWQNQGGSCQLINPDCQGEGEKEVYREVGADLTFNYLVSIWQKLAAPKLTRVYGKPGFLNLLHSGFLDPYTPSDGATAIAFSCEPDCTTNPSSGNMNYPIIGGYKDAREKFVKTFTPANNQQILTASIDNESQKVLTSK